MQGASKSYYKKQNNMNKTDQFNWWLTSIPDKKNALKESLPASIAGKLDGSLQSLDLLETYLLETYKTGDLTEPAHSNTLDMLASYVGDVAEKNLPGSKWTINTTDKDNIHYNFPVLKAGDYIFNPFSNITASIHRRKGNYLRERVEALQED